MTFVTGSISHGQGHATIQTQILVDRLGVDPEQIRFVQGDTEAVAFGMGTGGSRSTTMSGGAIVMVADKIIAKGKKLAAHMLEAAEADMEFKDGRFSIAGTDRSLGIHDVAKAAFELGKLPKGMEPGLYETATYRATSGNFPNGSHVCEVEIDPDTGATQVVGYWVVDDVGTVINPMLVKGQIMGGIAQGMGQVLMEDKAYDPQTGQVLSGSFMDYAMPRAENFCSVTIEDNPVPTPTNPLGVKGAGEAGTVGSLSAGVNAIVDALSVYGIRHIDTPCTPYQGVAGHRAGEAGAVTKTGPHRPGQALFPLSRPMQTASQFASASRRAVNSRNRVPIASARAATAASSISDRIASDSSRAPGR